MTDTSSPAVSRPDAERTVVYPSAMVPVVPSFVFTGPSGWIVDEAPGALLVLRSAEEVDGMWPSAILSYNRVSSSVTLEDAAKATWERVVTDSPDARQSFERVARFGTNVAFLRGFSFEARQGGGRVAQLHALFFAPRAEGRRTTDLFQFVITAPVEAMQQQGRSLVDMIASFRFV
jgi:hypothetical protein